LALASRYCKRIERIVEVGAEELADHCVLEGKICVEGIGQESVSETE
jgi:hypothetical protein